jgi:hypothetical protein
LRWTIASDSVGDAIRQREVQIVRLEIKLRQLRKVAPNIEALREAPTQRAAEWRQTLRDEPKVARLLLRKLIGPLVLVDESQNPNFVEADVEIKPALLEGLHDVEKGASPAERTHHVNDDGSCGVSGLHEGEKLASPTGFEPVFWP